MARKKTQKVQFERLVGGDGCELTVVCQPVEVDAGPHQADTKSPRKVTADGPDLSPEQQYICEHATD